MKKPAFILDDAGRDAYASAGVKILPGECAFITSSKHVVGVNVPSWHPVKISSCTDGENALDAFMRINNKYGAGEVVRIERLISLGCDLYAADFLDGRTSVIVRKNEAPAKKRMRKLTPADVKKLRGIVEWLRFDFEARMRAAYASDPLGCFVDC